MDKSSVNYKSIEAFLVIIDKHRLMIGLMGRCANGITYGDRTRRESYMGLFEDLQDEKHHIMIAKLTGESIDFSKLRQIARDFNEQNNAGLEVTGTDQELWSSITSYFRYLL